MATRTANTNGNTNNRQTKPEHIATATISGTLDNVYVGKKYCYATIHCYNKGEYYTPFKIKFPLDFDFPNDGDEMIVSCTIDNYRGSITFTASV